MVRALSLFNLVVLQSPVLGIQLEPALGVELVLKLGVGVGVADTVAVNVGRGAVHIFVFSIHGWRFHGSLVELGRVETPWPPGVADIARQKGEDISVIVVVAPKRRGGGTASRHENGGGRR